MAPKAPDVPTQPLPVVLLRTRHENRMSAVLLNCFGSVWRPLSIAWIALISLLPSVPLPGFLVACSSLRHPPSHCLVCCLLPVHLYATTQPIALIASCLPTSCTMWPMALWLGFLVGSSYLAPSSPWPFGLIVLLRTRHESRMGALRCSIALARSGVNYGILQEATSDFFSACELENGWRTHGVKVKWIEASDMTDYFGDCVAGLVRHYASLSEVDIAAIGILQMSGTVALAVAPNHKIALRCLAASMRWLVEVHCSWINCCLLISFLPL